jgi:hypothetical protein
MHGAWLDDDGRTPAQSRHVLFGALVGGPSQDGSYIDDRLDATRNEVADDYNAGFSSAVARLCKTFGGAALPDFPQPQKRDTEYVVLAKINTQGSRFTEISATIQNRTTWPARYSINPKIRYFIDCSEIIAAGRSLSNISVDLRGISTSDSSVTISKLLPYGSSGSIYYVEVGFAGANIFPGGQSACRHEAQFRIGIPDTMPESLWDPSNDPSFKGLTTQADTLGDWNIPAYENGVMVWGSEPNGTHFVPPVWQKPVFTEPRYNAPVWKPSLFKGAGDAAVVKTSTIVTPMCRINATRGRIFIEASTTVSVRCVGLNGRVLYSSIVNKDRRLTLQSASVSASPFVVYIADARSFRAMSQMVIRPLGTK